MPFPADVPGAVEAAPHTAGAPHPIATFEQRNAWLLLPVALVLAGTLAWVGAIRSGVWRDEALCLAVARLPRFGEVLAFLHFHESHPPLYYALLRGWEACVGASDLTARAISLACDLALVVLAYATGRRCFGRLTAGLAGLLVAIAPFAINQGGMARPYALEALLVTGAVAMLWQILATNPPWARAGYGLCLLAAVYAHNWAWLVFVAAGTLGLLLAGLTDAPPRTRLTILAVHTLVGLAYLPWLSSLQYQVAHAGHGANWLPYFGEQFWAFFADPWGLARGPAAILPTAIALSIVGLATRQAGRAERLGLVLCFGVPLLTLALAVALTLKTNMLIPWCFGMVLPCLLIGTAHTLAWVFARSPLVGRCLTCLIVAGVYVPQCLTIPSASNARELAEWVGKQARPTDLVVIATEVLASSFNHYYALPTEQVDFPSEHREELVAFDDVGPRWTDPGAFARVQERFRATHAAGRRVWFIGDFNEILPMVPALAKPAIPPEYRVSTPLAGMYRANQLVHSLVTLYGPPDLRRALLDPRPRREILYALLFDSARPFSSRGNPATAKRSR